MSDTTDERLARIETKLDLILSRQLDHENRLRLLEECAHNAQGGWRILAGIGAAAGILGGIVAKFLKT